MNLDYNKIMSEATMRLRKPSGRLRTTVLIVEGTDGTFLGVSRKNNWNDWGFPGGKSDEGEFITSCALRELKEETGLIALHMDLMDVRDYDNKTVDPVSHDEVWLYRVTKYDGELIPNGDLILRGEGITKWITTRELLLGSFNDYNRQILMEYY